MTLIEALEKIAAMPSTYTKHSGYNECKAIASEALASYKGGEDGFIAGYQQSNHPYKEEAREDHEK